MGSMRMWQVVLVVVLLVGLAWKWSGFGGGIVCGFAA
jgi:hypothetical protein